MIRQLFRPFCFLAIVSLLISGCSIFYSKPEPKIVKPPYELMPNALDNDFFRTQTGDLVGHYPKNWLQINTEKVPELENISLVYTDVDRQRAFVVTEIPGNADLRRKVDRDGIIAVAEESLQQKTKKLPTLIVLKQPEVLVSDGIRFSNYEYQTAINNETLRHRVICIATSVRYYEIAMVELHPSPDKMRYVENFRILQSVIPALEGVVPVGQENNPKPSEEMNSGK